MMMMMMMIIIMSIIRSILDFQAVISIFLVTILCYLAQNSLGGLSIQLSLHLFYQGNRGSSWSMKPKTSRDRRTRWCPLSTIPSTTPHCLVNTEGNVNCLGTRSLVYTGCCSARRPAAVSSDMLTAAQILQLTIYMQFLSALINPPVNIIIFSPLIFHPESRAT